VRRGDDSSMHVSSGFAETPRESLCRIKMSAH
jgi:hypothetical protein